MPNWGPLSRRQIHGKNFPFRRRVGMEVMVKRHCPDCTVGQHTMLLRIPSPITPWERHNLLEFAIEHPARMGEGELLSLRWYPVVRLQAGTVATHYTWNGACTIERGEGWRS